MNRIFKYELRRLLFNRFFLGLLAVNGLSAWYTLTSDTVAGIASTAPFSPWSFGAYLSSVMPMTILTVLFLLTFFYSKNEKQVKTLTAAMPVDSIQYTLVRMAVIALGFIILCVLIIGMSVYFYIAYFNFSDFSVFIIPLLVTVLPCFVFIAGAGHWAGRVHPGVIYALMPVSLAMNSMPLPGAFDFFGGGYYASFPLTLPVEAGGDPAFVLSAAFLASRAVYFAIGAALFVYSVFWKNKKSYMSS